MPRAARVKSESGVYHIILRGINKQVIFNDPIDNKKFIEFLRKYKEQCEFKLFAYCLMKNHVHLLVGESHITIEKILKKIGVSYVQWYNKRHDRIGHLFQDRYRSEPVESDKYFLSAIRYIHQNPMKAGIVLNLEEYEYSSYLEYTGQKTGITDTRFIFEQMTKKEFIKFNNEKSEDACMESENFRKTDFEAKQIIENFRCINYENYQLSNTKKFCEKIVLDLRSSGLTRRQIRLFWNLLGGRTVGEE